MEFETLEDGDFVLRKISPEVFNFIHSAYEKEKIKEFFAMDTEEEYLRERVKFKKGVNTYNRSFLYFQIIDNVSRVIGNIGYHTWYVDHHRAEIFYVLKDESKRRQGIMSALMPRVLQYGFREMNLNRIEAMLGVENEASRRLLEKFNFRQEGYLREHYFIDGVMEDSLVFSLLRKDYCGEK